MRSPTAFHLRAAATGVALAGALLLAGCSAQPGVAAVVDGRTISESELAQVHADLSAVNEVGMAPLLRAMILAPVITEGARDRGVGVSDAEARASLQQQAEAAGVDGSREFSEATVELRRSELAFAKLQALPDQQVVFGEILVAAQAMDVEVNPRYGTYGAEELSLTPQALPWIVAPAS